MTGGDTDAGIAEPMAAPMAADRVHGNRRPVCGGDERRGTGGGGGGETRGGEGRGRRKAGGLRSDTALAAVQNEKARHTEVRGTGKYWMEWEGEGEKKIESKVEWTKKRREYLESKNKIKIAKRKTNECRNIAQEKRDRRGVAARHTRRGRGGCRRPGPRGRAPRGCRPGSRPPPLRRGGGGAPLRGEHFAVGPGITGDRGKQNEIKRKIHHKFGGVWNLSKKDTKQRKRGRENTSLHSLRI